LAQAALASASAAAHAATIRAPAMQTRHFFSHAMVSEPARKIRRATTAKNRNNMLKILLSTSVFCLLLLNAGCLQLEKCPPAPVPVGAKLAFQKEGDEISAGLFQTVSVPHRVESSATAETWRATNIDETTKDRCYDAFEVDFTGTSISAVGDDVVQVISARRSGEDFTIDVACRPGPYPVEEYTLGTNIVRWTARSGSVWVGIRTPSKVRYEASFSMRCWQADKLVPFLSEPTRENPKRTYQVGEDFYFYYSIDSNFQTRDTKTGVVQTIRQRLQGKGLKVRGPDAPIEIISEVNGRLHVRAVRPGKNPVLTAGQLEGTLVVTIE
jgi:hypothetical protein